ncbi:hypothetical protein TSAR_016177, partial [Trichomalopsis sarcophagae]
DIKKQENKPQKRQRKKAKPSEEPKPSGTTKDREIQAVPGEESQQEKRRRIDTNV